jgi:predicted dehydrogenase
MLHAARKAGRRLMINFSFRFTDVALALRERVDAGHLGEPYFARTVWHRRRGIPGLGGWFTTKALSGGGPLIDLGVHRIDLALWFMGYPAPNWVMGATYDHIGSRLARLSGKTFDVEDLAVALVRFENGATLVAEASWAANIAEAELMETRVLGTEGGLLYRNVGEGYEFEAEFYTSAHGEVAREKIRPTGQAKGSAHHFIHSIITGTPHIATGEEGLIVMELLDAIYRSAETGEPVRISPA